MDMMFQKKEKMIFLNLLFFFTPRLCASARNISFFLLL